MNATRCFIPNIHDNQEKNYFQQDNAPSHGVALAQNFQT